MSDDVQCDGCKRHGKRRRRTIAPEGWFFLERKLEDEDDSIIIWACSEACKDSLWRPGPGILELEPAPGYRVEEHDGGYRSVGIGSRPTRSDRHAAILDTWICQAKLIARLRAAGRTELVEGMTDDEFCVIGSVAYVPELLAAVNQLARESYVTEDDTDDTGDDPAVVLLRAPAPTGDT